MSRHYLSVSPESNIREMACQSRVRVLDTDDQRAGDRDGELGKR